MLNRRLVPHRKRHGARIERTRVPRSSWTSLTDDTPYAYFCRRAAVDATVFRNFKRDPAYTVVLEHVSYSQGRAYLKRVLKQTPKLVRHFKRFRENDDLGNPSMFKCERSINPQAGLNQNPFHSRGWL